MQLGDELGGQLGVERGRSDERLVAGPVALRSADARGRLGWVAA
jgi:hypothetical protein